VDPAVDRLDAVESRYENNGSIPWERLTPEQRTEQVRKMATHAAMIEVMDRGIGRVIQALKDSGRYHDTLIVFTIDNGASPEVMVEAGYDRWSETRDGRQVAYGEYPDQPIGDDQTMACIGAQWASAADTPWRYWKAESYQGGTHAPFLMSWPARIGAREGTRVREPAHIVDVTPTLLDLAGVTPRTDKAPIDGISLAGVFDGRLSPQAGPSFSNIMAPARSSTGAGSWCRSPPRRTVPIFNGRSTISRMIAPRPRTSTRYACSRLARSSRPASGV
jgi:arylsulfatase